MTLNSGTLLNKRYRIVKTLGSGGFGAVYLAEDTRLNNQQVAVKETLDTSKEGKQRLVEEANLMTQLRHPNLVGVRDKFDENNGLYVVMDYVEGHDLWEEVELAVNTRTPIPIDQALNWIKQACAGLAHLHAHDIVHRDIKPQNMRRTAQNQIVLIDLGIAKKGSTTKTGRLQKGYTPVFAPPEQSSAGGSTSLASDVYAMGISLYLMVTATVPPESTDRLGNPPAPVIPPSQLNPNVTLQLEQIILKAVDLSSTRRYRDAGELLTALDSLSKPAPSAVPAWAPPPTVPPPGGAYVPRFCRYCGKPNTSRAKFCRHCGRPIARPAAAGASAGPSPASPAAPLQPIPSFRSSPQQYALDGDQCYQTRRYDDAIGHYQRAMRGGVKSEEMMLNLARCYVLVGRPDDALHIASASSFGAALQSAANGVLARAWAMKGDTKQAAAYARKAAGAGTSDGWVAQGAVDLAYKQARSAASSLRKAVKADPDDYEAWLQLGRALALANEGREAILALDKAAVLEPGLTDPHFYIAVIANVMGDRAREKREFDLVKQINPNDLKYQDWLAHHP